MKCDPRRSHVRYIREPRRFDLGSCVFVPSQFREGIALGWSLTQTSSSQPVPSRVLFVAFYLLGPHGVLNRPLLEITRGLI